ncbi:MAG: redoxin domain-containing protein [Caldilineaceae bacterium]|nr:redoxin domain-containing protein [Caldilineaceae bacterium]
MNRWHIIFVLTLILGGGWVWFSRVPVDAQPSVRSAQPAVGYPAPSFALTTLGGEEFALSTNVAMRDSKPIVLNFWATWCGPCRNELPALQAAAAHYAGYVEIIGVDQMEDAATVQAFVDELGLTFPMPLDADGAVGQQYNVRGLPTTYFIDRRGVIQQIWTGEMNRITLAEGIEKILP